MSMLPTPPLDPENHKPLSPSDSVALPEPMLNPTCEPTYTAKIESRRPRRNHSEIERRRRAKINDQFEQLRQLVPECRAFQFAKRGGDPGIHKLDILSGAVRYIHALESQLAAPP